MPSGSDLVVLFGPAMVGTFEQLGVHARDPSGMFQGAVGRTSPVSSRDLRLASTAGQPREIPFSMSVFGRFAWVTVSRTMSSWGSTRKVTTDGPFGRWSWESSNLQRALPRLGRRAQTNLRVKCTLTSSPRPFPMTFRNGARIGIMCVPLPTGSMLASYGWLSTVPATLTAFPVPKNTAEPGICTQGQPLLASGMIVATKAQSII